MDAAEITARFKRYFEETFPHDDEALTEATDLLNDWFVDSLGVVMTTLFIEQEFGIQVKRNDINAENLGTIRALTTYVVNRL